MFGLFGMGRVVERVDAIKECQDKLEKKTESNEKAIADLASDCKSAFSGLGEKVISMREATVVAESTRDKDLLSLSESIEKFERKFDRYAGKASERYVKLTNTDAELRAQVRMLMRIMDRGGPLTDHEKEQVNIYLQNNQGNTQGNQGQEGGAATNKSN